MPRTKYFFTVFFWEDGGRREVSFRSRARTRAGLIRAARRAFAEKFPDRADLLDRVNDRTVYVQIWNKETREFDLCHLDEAKQMRDGGRWVEGYFGRAR